MLQGTLSDAEKARFCRPPWYDDQRHAVLCQKQTEPALGFQKRSDFNYKIIYKRAKQRYGKLNNATSQARILLFSLFFAFGPVYWLPWMSGPAIMALKYLFLFGAIAMLMPMNRLRLSVEMTAWTTVLILTLLLSHLKNDRGIDMSLVAIPAIVAFFYNAQSRISETEILKIIRFSTYIFLFFQILVIIDFFRGGGIRNPLTETDLPLFMTGFSGGRTGWAAGVNIIFAAYFATHFNKSRLSWVFFIVSIIAFLNLFIVGSRGGILVFASLFIFQYFVRFRMKGSTFVFPIVATISIVIMVLIIPNLFSLFDLRILSFIFSDVQGYVVQKSQTREFGNRVALELFEQNMLLGKGSINLLDYGADYPLIHNAFLKIAAEKGALVFFSLMSLPILQTYRNYNRIGSMIGAAAFFSFLSGSLTGMVEPLAIFGSFFSTFYVWFLFGLSYRRVT